MRLLAHRIRIAWWLLLDWLHELDEEWNLAPWPFAIAATTLTIWNLWAHS